MTEEEIGAIHHRLNQLEVGQTNLEVEIKANTRLTNGLQEGVTEVLDILGTAKAGLKALGILGNVLKWSASFVAACAALWAAIHQIGGGIK